MSVYSKGSHIEMPFDVATPNIVEAMKRGHQEAVPVRRACKALPDDVVTEYEDRVFEEVLDAGEIFQCQRNVLRPPFLLVDHFILLILT